MTVGLVYLVVGPAAVLCYSHIKSIAVSEVMGISVFQVPLSAFFWGFLGGTSWSIYSTAYWSKRRLFDNNYVFWHCTHRLVSAVLGAAVALAVLGGLASLVNVGSSPQSGTALLSAPGSVLLSLVSFVSGFNTNTIWKFLDKSVRRIVGLKESASNLHAMHQEVPKELLRKLHAADKASK